MNDDSSVYSMNCILNGLAISVTFWVVVIALIAWAL